MSRSASRYIRSSFKRDGLSLKLLRYIKENKPELSSFEGKHLENLLTLWEEVGSSKRFWKWVEGYTLRPINPEHLYNFLALEGRGLPYKAEYYTNLHGVSEEVARRLVIAFKSDKVTSLEGFIKRYGPQAGRDKFKTFQKTSKSATDGLSHEEFQERSWMCTSFWVKRGLTEEEAVVQVSSLQKQNAGTQEGIYKRKGFSDLEVAGILKEIHKRQGYKTVELLKKKYGWSTKACEAFIHNSNVKQRKTKADIGLNTYASDAEAFKLYSRRVRAFTKKALDGQRVLVCVGSEQTDHKVSILHCFFADVPIHLAGGLPNLQVLTKEENLKKGVNSSITIQELYNLYEDPENFTK